MPRQKRTLRTPQATPIVAWGNKVHPGGWCTTDRDPALPRLGNTQGMLHKSNNVRASRQRLIARYTKSWLGLRRPGVLIFAVGLMVTLFALPGSSTAQQRECFTETGFCIAASDFQDYFHSRGGVPTFGYPISREFTLLAFRVQFFQGHILQRAADGSITTMNLLGRDLMPATHINGATFPASDPTLIAATPKVDTPEYSTDIVTFIERNVPNEFAGQPVRFLDKFRGTVDLASAFPGGSGNPALLPLLNLEIWGAVTSAPQVDPGNPNYIYQRFQRSIMHYRADCQCTERILIADWFKSVITGQYGSQVSTVDPPIPVDLASDMAGQQLLSAVDAGRGARPGAAG